MSMQQFKFGFILISILFLVCTLFMMTSCATMPETFRERLADAYSKHSAVAMTVAYGLETGALSEEEGENAVDVLRQTKSTLDNAKLLSETDLATAEGRINLAMASLIKLRDRLNAQGVQAP